MRVNKFMPNANYEILGGLKIKDGLFLGDQYAAQVIIFSFNFLKLYFFLNYILLGSGIHHNQQNNTYYQLCW